MKRMMIGLTALAVGTAQAHAQTTIIWPANSFASAERTHYFPMGTPITLTTQSHASSKFSRPGDRVYLQLAEPLMFQARAVVPAGVQAVGEIVEVQRNGHLGRKGKIAVRLLYLQTPYGPVRLGGKARDEGTSGTLLSVGTMLVVSWLGVFIHGTSANLPSGTIVQAHLMEDLRFVAPVATQIAQAEQAVPIATAAAPSPTRPLPDRFDPSAFSPGPQLAGR